MAEKAIIDRIYNPALNNGVYSINAHVGVSDGAGGSVEFTVTATATSFNPLVQTWRGRLRDAVVDKAAADHSLIVDQVMFPDCDVVNV